MKQMNLFIFILICSFSLFQQKFVFKLEINSLSNNNLAENQNHLQLLNEHFVRQSKQGSASPSQLKQNEKQFSKIPKVNFMNPLNLNYENDLILTSTLDLKENIDKDYSISYSDLQDYLIPNQISTEFKIRGREYNLILSTYSNILFLRSDMCSNCEENRYWNSQNYNCNEKRCNFNDMKTITSKYFQQRYVEGYVCQDVIELEDEYIKTDLMAIFSNSNVNFEKHINFFHTFIYNQFYEKNHGQYKGLIGFGAEKKNSLINKLYNQKAIKRNIFCLLLTKMYDELPQISFGEVNSLFKKDLVHFFPNVISNKWSILIQDVYFFEFNLIKAGEKKPKLIIALGLDRIIIPTNYYQKLMRKLKEKQFIGQNGTYECSELDYLQIFPPIQISFKDIKNKLITYQINPLQYIQLNSYNNHQECQLRVQQSYSDEDWVIGNLLLEHTYTIFNYDNQSIGFIDLVELRQYRSSNDDNPNYYDDEEYKNHNDDKEQSKDDQQSDNEDQDLEDNDHIDKNSNEKKPIIIKKQDISSSYPIFIFTIVGIAIIGLYIFYQKSQNYQVYEQDRNIELLPLNRNIINNHTQ